MEEAILISSSSSSMNNPDHACSNKAVELERKGIRGQKDQALNCPRCSSTNTKFCYYNNYSLTQPRYFCKTCRRYWTEGGTLRNVPVGGGSRKNKRSIITPPSSSSSLIKAHLPDLNPPLVVSHFSTQNPRMIIHEPPTTTTPHDLNLVFSLPQYYHGISQFSSELPKFENVNNNCPPSSSSSSSSSTSSHLKTEITSRGVSSFIQPAPLEDVSTKGLFPSGFPLQELKVPHLSFSAHLHGVDHQQSISTTGRVLFPFGEVKQLPTTTGVGHEYNNNNGNSNKGQGNSSVPAAYWNNAMFGSGDEGGGGGSW